MKQQARRNIYWFGINEDIKSYVKHCDICMKITVVSEKKSLSEWIPTNKAFSRIHADFFFFEKQTFLLIVDSHSKWLEIDWMRIGNDYQEIYCLPDIVVTDNGPPINAGQFVNFLERQGIRVIKSPPYHPQSNGQAERLVRVTKEVLKKFS